MLQDQLLHLWDEAQKEKSVSSAERPERIPPIQEESHSHDQPKNPLTSEPGPIDRLGEMPFTFEEAGTPREPEGAGHHFVQIFSFADGDAEEVPLGASYGETINVRMVEADRGDRPNAPLPQLVRDGAIPKYSGQPATFGDFKWEFERFLNLCDGSRNPKLTEQEKLMLLERALPEMERRRLQHLQRANKVTTYKGFMREMDGILSSAQDSQMLKRWNGLAIKHDGKITLTHLYEFQLEFDEIRHHLAYLTDTECHRHLMSKMPNHLMVYVRDEETRLQVSCPQILITLPGDHSEGVIKANMESLLKITATKVQKMGPGSYLFTLTDHFDLKKALESDGRPLARMSAPLRVKEVKRQLSIQGVFDYLRCKL